MGKEDKEEKYKKDNKPEIENKVGKRNGGKKWKTEENKNKKSIIIEL